MFGCLAKEGNTIEFHTCSNADRVLMSGVVVNKEQLGLVVFVDGIQYELKKLIDIRVVK